MRGDLWMLCTPRHAGTGYLALAVMLIVSLRSCGLSLLSRLEEGGVGVLLVCPGACLGILLSSPLVQKLVRLWSHQ